MRPKKKRTGNVPKSARKLVIGDKTYRYKIYRGSHVVAVWEPDGTKHITSNADLKNIKNPDVIDELRHDRSIDFAIIPFHIRRYIEAGFPDVMPYVDVFDRHDPGPRSLREQLAQMNSGEYVQLLQDGKLDPNTGEPIVKTRAPQL